jgi:2-polyprenyl-3-methyl-5-hydroxy-6-metoxy-1,4-benzoquinol methylase
MSDMDTWLHEVRTHVLTHEPDMLSILNTYQEEALFGRRYIADNLAKLDKGASILEVGAGALLLSCQLIREGFKVAALEPVGDGFSHFNRLRELVLDKAQQLDCMPELLNQGAEELTRTDCFDYAFSINVMEHVNDVRAVLKQVGLSLRPQARYHFTCSNYAFPYEQHFNIPTLFSKSLTEKVFRKKILCSNIPDAIGTWQSLNWISVRQVSRFINTMPELSVSFNQQLLVTTLARVAYDMEFAARRSKGMRIFIRGLIFFRLHHLAGFIPVAIQPIIDCTVVRN